MYQPPCLVPSSWLAVGVALRDLLHLELCVSIGQHRSPGRVKGSRWAGFRRALDLEGGAVCPGQTRFGGFGGPPVVVERPEQSQGQGHGQNLGNPDGHTQEAKGLQLLRSTDKAVDLWTAALQGFAHTHAYNKLTYYRTDLLCSTRSAPNCKMFSREKCLCLLFTAAYFRVFLSSAASLTPPCV